ncbi:MAG: CocE/NonD family hydrolase, partial [Erysipelotrichaceae bacterium]|nr:CocE/NonD family hydrolase [Erysipelotrichaceae bacterium]
MKEIATALPFNYPLKQERDEKPQKTLSFYLPSYDGTKIALDVTLPECAKEEKVPAIVMVTRGNRRNIQDFETAMGKEFVKAGYAHIIVELRGCGVSFGINRSFCDEDHCRDLLATVDWVEKQEWCSGKIGIYGGSNRSFIQLCAGALAPKNITAINPVVAVADFYYQNYPNGVSACPNISFPKPPLMPSKTEFLKTATPVDEDIAGDMAYEAFSQEQWPNNLNFFETLFMPSMNRDSEHPLYNFDKTNMTIPPYGKLDAFYKTGVKQHQFIGELESGTLGQLALFLDYGGSVCLGPWTHGGAIMGKSPFEEGDYSV